MILLIAQLATHIHPLSYFSSEVHKDSCFLEYDLYALALLFFLSISHSLLSSFDNELNLICFF